MYRNNPQVSSPEDYFRIALAISLLQTFNSENYLRLSKFIKKCIQNPTTCTNTYCICNKQERIFLKYHFGKRDGYKKRIILTPKLLPLKYVVKFLFNIPCRLYIARYFIRVPDKIFCIEKIAEFVKSFHEDIQIVKCCINEYLP